MTDKTNDHHLKYELYTSQTQEKGVTPFSFSAFGILHFEWKISIKSIHKKSGVLIMEFDGDGKSLMGTDYIDDFDHDDFSKKQVLPNGNTLVMLW